MATRHDTIPALHARALRGMIEPPSAIMDIVLRRKARLLNVSLLAMVAVFSVVDCVFLVTVPGYTPPWYGYLCLGLAYGLNRAGLYTSAASLVVAMFPCVAFAYVLDGDRLDPVVTLNYVALGPVLGAILLPMRGVALLSALSVLGLSLMPLLTPLLDGFQAVTGPLSATAIAALLSLVSMHHRNQVEADRQKELRESEQRTRLALEAGAMSTWEWLLDGDANRTGHDLGRMFGFDGDGLERRRAEHATRIHPGDIEEVERQAQEVIAGASEELAVTHRAVQPDGSIRWLESRGRVVSGSPRRIVGVSFDVTGRKQLEAELRQAQKMEAVGRLAGGIAHDFNNLLMVIVGNAELMRLRRPSPEVDQIAQAANSAGALTRQLLAFSRQGGFDATKVDLTALVGRVADMIGRLIGENIDVRLECARDLWLIRADENQIQHVLINLATNARDAMPEGGQLTIQTRNVRVQPGEVANVQPGDYVALDVSDSGIGMDEHTRARVFEPFFTTKQVGRGTGLGLSMAYATVTQAAGTIEVCSERGRGTTIKLLFPRSDAGTDSVETSAVAALPRPAHELVLLVEDDQQVRELCAGILREAGYEVASFASGGELLARVDDFAARARLLLTDIVLSDMRGTELADRLGAHVPTIARLFMTGYAPDQEPTKGSSPPRGGETLQKPFTPGHLLDRVRVTLARRTGRTLEAPRRTPIAVE